MDENNSSTDTHELILNAALERFSHYGYGKTTMAEIARDADMSAANLYRYFQNKQDIAAAGAERCMASMREQLQQVTDDPSLAAADKLEAYALAMFHYTHEQCQCHSRLHEMVEMVTTYRADLVHSNNAGMKIQLANILEQGTSAGDFDIEDTDMATDVLLTALVKFRVPIFMSLYSVEQFEQAARNTIRLLVRGLRKC